MRRRKSSKAGSSKKMKTIHALASRLLKLTKHTAKRKRATRRRRRY